MAVYDGDADDEIPTGGTGEIPDDDDGIEKADRQPRFRFTVFDGREVTGEIVKRWVDAE